MPEMHVDGNISLAEHLDIILMPSRASITSANRMASMFDKHSGILRALMVVMRMLDEFRS